MGLGGGGGGGVSQDILALKKTKQSTSHTSRPLEPPFISHGVGASTASHSAGTPTCPQFLWGGLLPTAACKKKNL